MNNGVNDTNNNQTIPGVKVAMPDAAPVDASTADAGAALSNAVRINEQPAVAPAPTAEQPVLQPIAPSAAPVSEPVLQPIATPVATQAAVVQQPVQPVQTVTNPEQPLGAEAKVLKLATLAMLFRKMKQDKVQTYLDKFSQDDAQAVIKFMDMPNLETKIDTKNALKCLQEIKANIPKSTQVLSTAQIVRKVQNVSQYLDRSQLELNLRLERNKVKRFVFSAMEGEYYNLPPKVANIIATHLEDSV